MKYCVDIPEFDSPVLTFIRNEPWGVLLMVIFIMIWVRAEYVMREQEEERKKNKK